MQIGSLFEAATMDDYEEICAVLEEPAEQLWMDECHQQPKELETAKVRENRAAHILKLEDFGVVKEIDVGAAVHTSCFSADGKLYACAGENKKFDSESDCLAQCGYFPTGTGGLGTTSGNNLACRAHFASMAAAVYARAIH